MKIGIFGGTFNPIHKSHIYLAEQIINCIHLDKIFFVPTYTPPHKTVSNLASSKDRYNMIKLAIQGNNHFKASDFEINKKGESFTFETLEYFTSRYKNAEFFLLMGSDMFLTMKEWKNPTRIYELSTLCAIAREANEYDVLNKYKDEIALEGAKSIILKIKPAPMSSTDIRKKVYNNEPISSFVDLSVERYINEHGLYKSMEG